MKFVRKLKLWEIGGLVGGVFKKSLGIFEKFFRILKIMMKIDIKIKMGG